jgi:hypothetical protein
VVKRITLRKSPEFRDDPNLDDAEDSAYHCPPRGFFLSPAPFGSAWPPGKTVESSLKHPPFLTATTSVHCYCLCGHSS